jgi:hypothetical protein
MPIMGEEHLAAVAKFPRTRVPVVLAVIAAVIAGLGGYAAGLSRERHSATAVVLTGTVTWSNVETRLIAFDTDGVIRKPNDEDTIYSVLADNWQDVEGTIHSGGSTYPACLAAKGDDPVSMEHHRAELTVIDWDAGGAQWMRVAVQVRCLD